MSEVILAIELVEESLILPVVESNFILSFNQKYAIIREIIDKILEKIHGSKY